MAEPPKPGGCPSRLGPACCQGHAARLQVCADILPSRTSLLLFFPGAALIISSTFSLCQASDSTLYCTGTQSSRSRLAPVSMHARPSCPPSSTESAHCELVKPVPLLSSCLAASQRAPLNNGTYSITVVLCRVVIDTKPRVEGFSPESTRIFMDMVRPSAPLAQA